MTDIGLGKEYYYVEVAPLHIRLFRTLDTREISVQEKKYLVCDVISRIIPTDIEGKPSTPYFKTDSNVAVSREWLDSSCEETSWEDWDYALDKASAYYFRDLHKPYDATQDDWGMHIWGRTLE